MEKQYLYDIKTKSSLNKMKLKKMNLLEKRDYFLRTVYGDYLFFLTVLQGKTVSF